MDDIRWQPGFSREDGEEIDCRVVLEAWAKGNITVVRAFTILWLEVVFVVTCLGGIGLRRGVNK